MDLKTIKKNDCTSVDKLIREAFSNSEHGYGNEAELVENLRLDPDYNDCLEVVAFEKDKIVGHGLLSEVKVVNENQEFIGLVLAPLSVLPSFQKYGVGKALMHELEKRAIELDYNFISILGHPDYYPKFGYKTANRFDIKAPFDVPDEAFMIKPLTANGLQGVTGTIEYSKAFA